jgi:SAM-dependent methyltransferase
MNADFPSPRFDSRAFPQYDRLSFGERLFLRTCCYYPPRPRRVRTLEYVRQTERHETVIEIAFGPEIWSTISGREILDLGCGEGGHVLALAARGAGFVTGVDILPGFHHADQESRRLGYPVRFVVGRTEDLADASFDVVISHDSFEHFAEPERLLAEMTRLTRPDGRLFIKFGPPWRNPWGRHMGGTIRRDRPWIHLIVPERTIMHAQSVYHNQPALNERYADLPGGLNKMTIGRFKKILHRQAGVRIEQFKVFPLYGIHLLVAAPLIREFFASGVRAICVRE